MFRHGARVTLRFPHSSLAPARTAISTGRRHVTTAPPHATSRTWKNSALRWGVAVAGIYYYNTSPVFADHPQSNLLNPNVDALDDNRQHDTLDQLTASSRNKANRNPSVLQTTIEQASAEDAAHRQENDLAVQTSVALAPPPPSSEPVTTGAAELEEEAQGEGAFNPVTGEINWDCPCLGGMAYGPCGPEFREAFSCFVYSKEEPKGMDCIEKFQGMQTCFREHPEHYKDEIEDDETLDAELAEQREKLQERTSETKAQANELKKEVSERVAQLDAQQQIQRKSTTTSSEKQSPKQKTPKPPASESTKDPQPEAKTTSHTPSEFSSQKESEHGASSRIVGQPQAKEPSSEAQPESESLVPKASHDATGASATDSYSVAK